MNRCHAKICKIVRRIFGIKILKHRVMLVTIKQCDRQEYFIKDFKDIDYEFEMYETFKELKEGVKDFSIENRERIRHFLFEEPYDVLDVDFYPATLGSGRRWFIMFKMKGHIIKTHKWQYQKIYEDITESSTFHIHERKTKLKKLCDDKHHL